MITMIDKYESKNGDIIIISKMDDNHLLNSQCYFACKRLKMQDNPKFTGKDVLKISLLINSLNQEIDKRELLKY